MTIKLPRLSFTLFLILLLFSRVVAAQQAVLPILLELQLEYRVVGKPLSKPQPFDPTVAAISSATMTWALVFNSLAQGVALIKELWAQGLR